MKEIFRVLSSKKYYFWMSNIHTTYLYKFHINLEHKAVINQSLKEVL